MSKYIVKNCPACLIHPHCCTEYTANTGEAKSCSDITDCLIKQVINVYRKSKNKIAKEMLSYFEIEECEQ